MTLVELRKQGKLTQKEAAALMGIPYRTYVRYEEDVSYLDSYKYRKLYDDLFEIIKIDETHGVHDINTIIKLSRSVLEKYGVKRCYLFGSYARGEAKPTSDIDLLIDTNITGLDFLNLIDGLRTALCKKIDLLRMCDLQNGNPIILEILKEGIKII